jgi:hypothetical protein
MEVIFRLQGAELEWDEHTEAICRSLKIALKCG